MTDNFFNRLRTHREKQLPFVVYRKPNETQVQAFLQQDEILYTTEDFSASGFVLAPFDQENAPLLIPETGSERLSCEIHAGSWRIPEGSANRPPDASQRERHLQLLGKSLEKLREGSLEKVVLSRKEEVQWEDSDPIYLFQDLLQSYPAAFTYLWYHPKVGCWMAATPEVLLMVEGRDFQTMALAGTRKYEGDQAVEWGEKERKEQQFVTDDILANLQQYVSEVQVSETQTVRAGNLWHLRTDIKGKIKQARSGLQGIISALHPTPAVCGIPREKARDFILREEGYDREFYTGFLGELNLHRSQQRARSSKNVENLAYRSLRKTTSLFVNLRCMKLEGEVATIFVGGGITKDSDPQSEWEETVHKAQTLKTVLLSTK